MDIKSVQQNLGITKEQTIALDRLDGKEDGQISQDIFTQAREAITNQKGNANFYNEALKKDNTPIYHQIISILQGMAPKKSVAKAATQTKVPKEVDTMQKMAEEALKYYAQNGGKLEGFKFTGFPRGITNLCFSTQTGYDDYSNDVFSVENGSQVVNRNADAFTLTIKFVFNGKEYSVKSETKDLSGITTEARQEFVSGMEQMFMNKAEDNKSIKTSNESVENKNM